MEDLTDARVAIAVLQTNYDNLSERVVEVRDEMRTGLAEVRTGMSTMNGKFDLVIQGLREREAASKLRSRVMSAISHAAAGSVPIVTLIGAKLLHIPISLG